MLTEKELKEIPGQDLQELLAAYFVKKLGEEERLFDHKYSECLKYLYLLSKYQNKLSEKFMPLTAEVDELWHFLIIQTRQYQKLCERLPGQKFLHHQSLAYQDYLEKKSSRQENLQEILAWIPLYVKNFGAFSRDSGRHWKIINYLHHKQGMSYADISALR